MYEPLKITFELRTPVVLAHPWLHFDGILAHMALRDALGPGYFDLPSKAAIGWEKIVEKKSPLPLAKFCVEGDCIFKASVALFETEGFQLTTIYKRFFEAKAHEIRKAKKVDVVRGPFRSWALRLPYVPSKKAVFYAVGDEEEIGKLLRHLPGLGKKTAIGFGEIRSFTIERSEDNSLVMDGIAMRPIPVKMLRSFSEAFLLACSPPYWLRENVRLAAPPGALVELRAHE
ncbi:MAG: hypothetical protein QXP84_07665 [Candidatus Korarchaeum sp.]